MKRRKVEEPETVKEVTEAVAPKPESVSAKVVVAERNGPEDRMKVLFNQANKELLNQIKRNSPYTTSDEDAPLAATAAPSAAAASSDIPGTAAARPPDFAFTKSVELAMDETDGAIRPPPLNERFSASIFDLPLPETESGSAATRYQQQTMRRGTPPRPHLFQQQQQQRHHPQPYREPHYRSQSEHRHQQHSYHRPYPQEESQAQQEQQRQQQYQPAVMAGSRRSNNDLIDDDEDEEDEEKPCNISVTWHI